jgi:Ni/Fe-hydrogenase 1 B-type cytochrome subunit
MTTAVPAKLSAAQQLDAAELARGRLLKTVYVYEAPLRLWHWVNALSIMVLCVTGYFIGSPPATQPGEASAHFLMGYIRFAHFSAGYVLTVALLGRVYWAIVGNRHARELVSLPLFSGAFWKDMGSVIKWYAFMGRRPGPFVGHNPLSRLAMFAFMLVLLCMICTGFAMYAEGAQRGSWQDALFGWVIPMLGQSQDAHTWHHLGMWTIVCFVIMHVYAAIREDIMGRTSLVSTMLSGFRVFKD